MCVYVCVRICACVYVCICLGVCVGVNDTSQTTQIYYYLMCATTCVQRVQFSIYIYFIKDSSYFYSHPRDISSQDRLNFSFNRSSDNKSHNLFILPVRTGLVKIKGINLSRAHFPRVSNQVGI